MWVVRNTFIEVDEAKPTLPRKKNSGKPQPLRTEVYTQELYDRIMCKLCNEYSGLFAVQELEQIIDVTFKFVIAHHH